MKKNSTYRTILLFLISVPLLISVIVYCASDEVYPISGFFPLNTNDCYIYDHYEGVEKGVASITVKNVRKEGKEKFFNFFWQGNYNDRIQYLKLSAAGLILLSNRHLVGRAPLRVIRKFSPPLLMIPSRLNKCKSVYTAQLIYDWDAKLIGREDINANIRFVGTENVSVGAGSFRCLHFRSIHNYTDSSKNSIQMHTYDFWLAYGVGVVKFIHTFVPFIYIEHIPLEQKNIMNRYSDSFAEVFELKEASIKGKVIKQ